MAVKGIRFSVKLSSAKATNGTDSNKNTVNKILLYIIILFYSLFQFVYLFIRRNKKAESFIDKIIYLKLYFLPIKKELYRDLFPNSSFTNA